MSDKDIIETISSDEDYLYSGASSSRSNAEHREDNMQLALLPSSLSQKMQIARRSPSPYSSYQTSYESFSEEMKLMKKDNRDLYTYYRENNEKHPKYKEEWTAFWNQQSKKAMQRNEEPRQDIIVKNFVHHWKVMLTHFEKDSYQKRKSALLRKHSYERSPSPLMSRSSFYDKFRSGGRHRRRREGSSSRERSTSRRRSSPPRGRRRRRSKDRIRKKYSSKKKQSRDSFKRRQHSSRRSSPEERRRKRKPKKKKSSRHDDMHIEPVVDDNIMKVLLELVNLPNEKYFIVSRCKSLLLQAFDMEKIKEGFSSSLLERPCVQQLLLVAKDKLAAEAAYGGVSKEEKTKLTSISKRIVWLLEDGTMMDLGKEVKGVNVTQVAREALYKNEKEFAKIMARHTWKNDVKRKDMLEVLKSIVAELTYVFNKVQEIPIRS